MSTLYGKLEYLRGKLEVPEKCESGCDEKNRQCCNICWWKNVLKTPEEMIEKNLCCTTCINDTNKLKKMLVNSGGDVVELEIKCCQWCLWWDWFHSQREKMAKNANKTLVYMRQDKAHLTLH